MEVSHSSVEDGKLNLGIFIAGYKGEESKYISTISGWKNVFDRVVLFTDSRLDESSMFDYISEFEKYDFATMGIPILDWYIENAEFLKSISLAQYITYYSDLCRWFVMKHLNNLYKNDINGNTQPTYYLVVPETSTTYTTDLKARLVRESQDKFVAYGNDKAFFLDGELQLRSSGEDFTSRICLGFNMGKKNLLDKNFFRTYGALNPFENMIKLSIANPDVNEEGILELFRNFMGRLMVWDGRADVLFNYEAEDETNITIKAGDVVVVVNNSDANWWDGYLESEPEKIGFFPASFVKPQVGDSNPKNAFLKMIISGKDNELVQEEKEEFIKYIPLSIGAPIGLMYTLKDFYTRIDGDKKFSTFFNRIPVGKKHWSKFGDTTGKGDTTESPSPIPPNVRRIISTQNLIQYFEKLGRENAAEVGREYIRPPVTGGGNKTKNKNSKRKKSKRKKYKRKKYKRRTFNKSKNKKYK